MSKLSSRKLWFGIFLELVALGFGVWGMLTGVEWSTVFTSMMASMTATAGLYFGFNVKEKAAVDKSS